MWRIRIFSIIDLFATRTNTQLRPFVSYRTNLNCVAVNVFLINWEKNILYIFSICVFIQIPSKDLAGYSKRYADSPRLAFTTILPKINRNIFTNHFYSSQEKNLTSTKPIFTASPTAQKTVIHSFLSRWSNDLLTKNEEDLIINSSVEETRKQYKIYFGRWKGFCEDRQFSLTNASRRQNARNSYFCFTKKD